MIHKSEISRFLRNFFVYGVGGILQRFMSLLLLPLFTRVLTQEDYGALSLAGFVAVAVSGLFSLGTGNSMGLLFFKEQVAERRVSVVWSNAALVAANGIVLAGLLCLLAGEISILVFESAEYADLLRLTFIGLAVSAVTEPFLAYLRMEDRARDYVLLTLSSALMTILISVLLVLWLGWGVIGAAVASVASGVLLLIMVLYFVAMKLPFKLDITLFKPLVTIGFPSIFGLFAFLLIDYADRQMLQRIAGLEALGVYSVGYSFGMAIMIVVGAFSTAWPPYFMSFINRQEEASVLFGKLLRFYLIAFGMLLLGFFAAARPMVEILAGPGFQDAFIIIGMVAAAYMLKGCYLIFLPGLYYKNRLGVQSAIEWLAAIVNLALNFAWIPKFGIAGAAAATLISYLSLPVCTWLISRHYLKVRYDKPRLALVIGTLVVACALLWMISSNTRTWLAFGVNVAVAFVAALILLLLGLSKAERTAGVAGVATLLRVSSVRR